LEDERERDTAERMVLSLAGSVHPGNVDGTSGQSFEIGNG
jgi:hypothetical protein